MSLVYNPLIYGEDRIGKGRRYYNVDPRGRVERLENVMIDTLSHREYTFHTQHGSYFVRATIKIWNIRLDDDRWISCFFDNISHTVIDIHSRGYWTSIFGTNDIGALAEEWFEKKIFNYFGLERRLVFYHGDFPRTNLNMGYKLTYSNG